MERSEEDVLAGVLPVRIGGVAKTLPTLKVKHVAAWGDMLSAVEGAGKPLTEWTVADAGFFGSEIVRRMLDLVVAYDRTAALGGREWLEENADPTELHEALVAMAGNAFPLADAATTVNLSLTALAAQSVRPSSTNGASSPGTAIPMRSARRSTRSS